MDLNGAAPFRFNRNPSRLLGAYPHAPKDIPSASSSTSDGDLNEDDIFSADFSHPQPPAITTSSAGASPSSSFGNRSFKKKSGFETSGILAALPEPSGSNHSHHQFFNHKASAPPPPPLPLSTSVSSTASASSSSSAAASVSSLSSSSSSARMIPSIPKPPQERIPFLSSSVGGGKFHQSAPVNVPILSQAMMNRRRREFDEVDIDEEEEEEEGEEMLPPHEIVARSMARSPMLSCSVLEGAGRTLKGRDLRQVRNAIFRKTGFID